MSEYFVVSDFGQGELVEKKSRFIAHVYPIQSEEEAISYIEKIKKQYWDARHNCFAFVVGKNNEVQRFSDDGEPQGTAGKPILEVLTGAQMHNTLIVVTRYFGGTLLGTGGLVRAYGGAAKEGLKNAVIEKVCDGISFHLRTDYNNIGKIKYILEQMHVRPQNEEYGTDVIMDILMKYADYVNLKTQITDVTSGQAEFTDEKETSYSEKVDSLF